MYIYTFSDRKIHSYDSMPNIQLLIENHGVQDKDWEIVKEQKPEGDNWWYDGERWFEKGVFDRGTFETNEVTITPLDESFQDVEIGINGENVENITHIKWVETNRKTREQIIQIAYPIEKDYFYDQGECLTMVRLKGHEKSVFKKDVQFKITKRIDFRNIPKYDYDSVWWGARQAAFRGTPKYDYDFNVGEGFYDAIIFDVNNDIHMNTAGIFQAEEQGIKIDEIFLQNFMRRLSFHNCIFINDFRLVGTHYKSYDIYWGHANIRDSVFLSHVRLSQINTKEYSLSLTNNTFQRGIYLGDIKTAADDIYLENNYAIETIDLGGCDVVNIHLQKTHANTLSLRYIRSNVICLNYTVINNIELDDTSHLKHIFASQIHTNNFHFQGVETESLVLNESFIDKIYFEYTPSIKHINTYNTMINKAHTYQNFTMLKNIAVNNNDKVQALEYHIKEANTHLYELWSYRQWHQLDKMIILAFSRVISQHGTNPFRALLALVFLHIISAIILYYSANLPINEWHFFNALGDSILDTNPFKPKYIFEEGLRWLVLFKTVMHYILLYEIIQSFRQFNRKF